MQTRITSKGQVVIPAAVRRRRHIEPGQRFTVVDTEEEIRLVPVRVLTLDEAEGFLKTKKSARRLLAEARREDEVREARLKSGSSRRRTG